MPTQSLLIKNSLLNWNCFSQRPIDINIYYLIIILIISQTVRLGIRQRRKWCISQKSLFIPCTWCCFTQGVVSVMWAAVFSTAKKKKILHLTDKKWKERNILLLDSVLKHHAPPDVTICMVQNFNLKSKSKEFIIDPRFLPVNGWSAGITHNTGFSFFLIALCVGSSSTISLPCNAYNKLHLTLFPISKNLHVRTQWFKNLLAEIFSLIPKNNYKNLFSQANSSRF